MFKSYLKLAWRNLLKSKMYSGLNIVGLATGMAVALIIGLWVWDELSFDKYHRQRDRIAQVMVNATVNNKIFSGSTVSIPMGIALHENFSGDFKYVSLATHPGAHIIALGDKKLSQTGRWVEEAFPIMFTLRMLSGQPDGLKDPSSVLIAESVAKSLFNNEDPVGKMVRIDNKMEMKVAGVYEDLPHNTSNREVKILLPWLRYVNDTESWIKKSQTEWENHMCNLFVQLQNNADINKVNDKIKSVPTPYIKFAKEELLLHPMDKWHLYGEFDHGRSEGGLIQMVWLFATIGVFVLLLACINFMNLSTARSEKRSREVGIRKTIGSLRSQLIVQFLSESLTLASLALVLAIIMVQLSLPLFNSIADKSMSIPWSNPVFWLAVLIFTFFTGLVSGSYPAFYLSGFQPVKVLKGTFKAGRAATLPRKVLVVIQFAVSVTLIIGTFIVYEQIQHARNRPVGYTREGLITVDMNTPDFSGHFDAIRNDLLQTGAVSDMALSNSAPTTVWSNNVVDWKGKDPNLTVSMGTIAVSHDFGNTVGWTMKEGRDFSRNFPTDTFAFILNESAVKITGFKNPVGQTIRWLDRDHVIIGVVKDMVMESPYEPIRPTIFHLNPYWSKLITVRIRPGIPVQDGLAKIEPVFKRYNPGSPFVYKFTDEEYARKFSDEKRIGNLTTIFAILAVFISCLGLFGLASFVAEQRTKEIGIRKVLGASVFNVWRMLSKDFVSLVLISCAFAVPIAWYLLNEWLQKYEYRITIPWWIFTTASLGALLVTIITVTYQAIRAAVINPIKSLKSE
jgi:putative ABC transport system permease protein